mmetsp:Transcript_31412/g.55275  ORF Transcript_31412/g.55275 Transcript_31412/m.55275 type:complete len:206 (-) Transcript_31412:523-1140(-)
MISFIFRPRLGLRCLEASEAAVRSLVFIRQVDPRPLIFLLGSTAQLINARRHQARRGRRRGGARALLLPVCCRFLRRGGKSGLKWPPPPGCTLRQSSREGDACRMQAVPPRVDEWRGEAVESLEDHLGSLACGHRRSDVVAGGKCNIFRRPGRVDSQMRALESRNDLPRAYTAMRWWRRPSTDGSRSAHRLFGSRNRHWSRSPED